jgi:hypothetical protein
LLNDVFWPTCHNLTCITKHKTSDGSIFSKDRYAYLELLLKVKLSVSNAFDCCGVIRDVRHASQLGATVKSRTIHTGGRRILHPYSSGGSTP